MNVEERAELERLKLKEKQFEEMAEVAIRGLMLCCGFGLAVWFMGGDCL